MNKQLSKRDASIAVMFWMIGAAMLVPLKQWIITDHEYNGAKFIVVLVGLMVLKGAYSAFKKNKAIGE